MVTGASGGAPPDGTPATPQPSIDAPEKHHLEMIPPLTRGMDLLAPEKAPTFDVDAFLSSRTRGQDVYTILSELREYKSTLRDELVTTVNEEYRDFVTIATAMHQEADKIRAIDGGSIGKARASLVDMRTLLSGYADEIKECISANANDEKEEQTFSTLIEITDVLNQLAVDVGVNPQPRIQKLDLSAYTGEADVDGDAEPEDYRAMLTRALDRYRWFTELCGMVQDEYPLYIEANSIQIYRVRERMSLGAFHTLDEALATKDNDALELALACAAALEPTTPCISAALERIHGHLVHPWLAAHMPGSRLEDADAPADTQRISEELYTSDRAACEATGLAFPSTALTPDTTGLVRLYNGCLALLASTAGVCAAGARAGVDVFGAVWHLVVTRLMQLYGAQLFFVGHADAFHQHYTASRAFIAAWAAMAPDEATRSAFLANPTTRTFERRWQLSAYLHLRMRETVVVVEDALSGTRPPAYGFVNGELSHLLSAFVRPWLPAQHAQTLCAREWHFSLQIASRYRTWALSKAEHESSALAVLAALPADAHEFEARAARTLDDVIVPRLCADDALRTTLHDALREAFVADELGAQVSSRIVDVLKNACSDPLRHVRAAAAQYRGTRDQGSSGATSAFIPELVRPLRSLLDELDARARGHAHEWAQAVVTDVLARYAQALETISQNLESLRRLKRGTGLDAGALPGAGIYAQMRTDVDALRTEVQALDAAHSLGLDVDAALARLERISHGSV